MTKGTRIKSQYSDETGIVLDVKTETDGEETETAYLVAWDLDDEWDEPGWRWSFEITPAAA